MRLNSALISIFSFVSAVLSGHLREKDQPWFPRRVMLESTNGASDGVSYSDRFAGAFLQGTGEAFTFATATFNLPAPSGQHDYSAWISFDGINTNISWFSAGISAMVMDNNETTYQAWYSWGSKVPYYSNFTITPEDDIRVSMTVLNATSGALIFENLNNGQANVHHLLVNSTLSLFGREVSWGVALVQVNEPIPFDTVTITNAMTYGPSGRNYEADSEGVTKMKIKQDNKVVTSVETKGSNITIQHMHE